MAYYQKPTLPLGDIPPRVKNAVRVSGGARRAAIAPPMPTRSGTVIGGVPKMSAVRRTMASQGFAAEGSISRGSNFVPEMLQATHSQLVKGYAGTIQARAKAAGVNMSNSEALRQSKAEYSGAAPAPTSVTTWANSAGQPIIPTQRQIRARDRALTNPIPPQLPLLPMQPLIDVMAPMPGIMTLSPDGTAIGDYGVATRRLAHSRVLYGSGGSAPLVYSLGDDEGLGGFSLKGIVKSVSKAVKTVASPVQKVAAAVGHTAGTIVTSKAGQAILGTALAATGVGIPAAAAIMGGTKAIGNLVKPGGNIKHAATGLFQGAAEGIVAGAAGQAFKAIAPNAQASTSNFVKSVESKFVQGAKTVGSDVKSVAGKGLNLAGKGAMGVVHAGETVIGGVAHGTAAVVGGVAHAVGGLFGGGSQKVVGVPGSFTPTADDPNGDGINNSGMTTSEADSAIRAGRAHIGTRLPVEQRPRVGTPGSFPTTPTDPAGTGVDMTGMISQIAQAALDKGAAVLPTQLPPDAPPPPQYYPPYGGSGGGGGGAPSGGSGFDPASLAAGAGAAAAGAGVDAASMTGGLGGLLGNINPTLMIAGAAAFFILPKLMGGGSGGGSRRAPARRAPSRSRSRRR